MELFYEESATLNDTPSNRRRARAWKISFIAVAVFAIISIIFVVNFMHFIVALIEAAVMGALLVFLWVKYNKSIVDYDYVFVSGELRIARVFRRVKRRTVARISCENIIQMGDTNNPSFERLRNDPNVPTIVCTSNKTAATGKFMMYILVNDYGKNLYLLECREELLVNMLKFAKRTVLEPDYVAQAKKAK